MNHNKRGINQKHIVPTPHTLMGILESDGSSDFSSIFPSEAERKREDEERVQTERLLDLLDELENRQQLETPRDFRGHRKEYMRVSITGDDEDGRDDGNTNNKKDDKKGVHTLNDLPRDEFDFFVESMVPDKPNVNIEAGRRLKDGKISYHTSIPFLDWFYGDDGTMNGETIMMLLFLAVFLFGIYIGRRSFSGSQLKQPFQTHAQPLQQPQIVYAYPPEYFKQSGKITSE